MAGYDGRGARFDVVAVTGNDISFTVTAVDSDAVAVDLSAATIVGTVYNGAGTAIDTLTDAVGGAGSNVITLSLTDTEVDALTDPATWALKVTRGGDDRTWLAGTFKVVAADRARTGTSGTAVTATVDTNVTVTAAVLTSAGGGGAVDSVNAQTGVVVLDADDIDDTATTNKFTTAAEASKLAGIEAGAQVNTITAASTPSDLTPDVSTTQAGTTYTIDAADDGTVVVFTAAGLVTVTVPTDAADDLRDGYRVALYAAGAAGLTLSTVGLTLVGSAPSTTAAQDGVIYLEKTSTANTWVVVGPSAAGTVDTSGTPVANDIARFTDADTIEGLSYAELRTAINVEDGADVTDATNVAAAGAVMASIVDAKGDLVVATAADTVTRLAVGATDGHVLTVDAAEAAGVKWAAAAGGGGGPTVVVKTADETVNNSAVLQDDNDLTVAIASSETLLVEVFVYGTSSATADFRFNLTAPAGATIVGSTWGSRNDNLVAMYPVNSTGIQAWTGQTSPYRMVATVINSTTAGSVTFQWAQNTAEATDTIVKAGSAIMATSV